MCAGGTCRDHKLFSGRYSLPLQECPEDQSQVVSFGSKCLYTLSCFPSLMWLIVDINTCLF